MTTTIQQEGNSLEPDTYLELFDLDTTSVGGIDILYYTNTYGDPSNVITWRTKDYTPFPFKFEGAQYKSDGTAPARPTITVSNVHKTLLVALYALGDLTGVTVRRWRTFYKFTDNGTEPNIDAHFPQDEFIITKVLQKNKHGIQFELSNALDRPNLKLPRRQILKDFGFPGVSRIRLRG